MLEPFYRVWVKEKNKSNNFVFYSNPTYIQNKVCFKGHTENKGNVSMAWTCGHFLQSHLISIIIKIAHLFPHQIFTMESSCAIIIIIIIINTLFYFKNKNTYIFLPSFYILYQYLSEYRNKNRVIEPILCDLRHHN